MAIRNTKTFAQVQTELIGLPLGEHKLTDVVDIIMQCETFKDKTLDSFKAAIIDKDAITVNLDEVYIDLTYQRKLKLKKILKHLQRSGGFNKEEAGHVDIATRTNGKRFVWDGFRRSTMALLCGMTELEFSSYTHPTNKTLEQQQIKEAGLFIVRNSKNENMGADEIFFARYAAGCPHAKKMKKVLDRAKINVCGLNPSGRSMGGFASVEEELGYQEREEGYDVKKNISDDDFVTASEIVQGCFPKVQLGAYLLCALANVRKVLREDPLSEIPDTELTIKMVEWSKTLDSEGNAVKQKTLTERIIKNKTLESITYNILKEVLKLNGRAQKLSGLTKENAEYLEDTD